MRVVGLPLKLFVLYSMILNCLLPTYFAYAFGSYVLSLQSPLFTEKMRRGVESYFVELFFPAIYFIEDHKRLDVSMRSGQVKLQ